VISQYNGTSSVTPSSDGYVIDRFKYEASQTSKFTIQQNAGSVTPPAGFTSYLGFTTASAVTIGSSDYFQTVQIIEGLNIGDLGWGTANAKTVTLSFWVRSSLTGTFGGSLRNSAVNRSYPFSYTISAANTWEQKSITIAGDTSGTWLTTNGVGIRITFGLGNGSTFSGTAGAWAGANYQNTTGATSVVGTAGATFYITGVQLEVGSAATSFDYRSIGTELNLCQRYFQTFGGDQNNQNLCLFQAYSTTALNVGVIPFFAKMRTVPTFTYSALSDFYIQNSTGTGLTPTVIQIGAAENSTTCGSLRATVASGLTAGNAAGFFPANTSARLNFSAEL
jgi:hypothetical protein